MAHDSITIQAPSGEARARITPHGFNCYSFQAGTADGPLETLWSHPEFLTGGAKPSSSGIPIMFPFAGRIRGTAFEYEGKTYPLEAGDGQGNAIHGFVMQRTWRILEQGPDRVVGEFQASRDDASLLGRWPADFRIRASYRLADNTLISEFTIENPDNQPLPFGFGTHPYFRLPLGGPSAADCQIRVGVKTNWELEGLLPTGEQTKPELVEQLSSGLRLGEIQLDNVFGGLTFNRGEAAATVHDPHSTRTLTLRFDDQYTACVIYTPPHREAICIEPYTTIPDPFNLQKRGIEPHLREISPGEEFRTRIDMRLS